MTIGRLQSRILVSVCVTTVGLVGLAGVASGSASRPTITSFSASPRALPATGGSFNLAATVASASTCEISSIPAINGFPLFTPCSSGSFDTSITLSANTHGKTLRYRFRLAAIGVKTAKATTQVGESAGWVLHIGAFFSSESFPVTNPGTPETGYPPDYVVDPNGVDLPTGSSVLVTCWSPGFDVLAGGGWPNDAWYRVASSPDAGDYIYYWAFWNFGQHVSKRIPQCRARPRGTWPQAEGLC